MPRDRLQLGGMNRPLLAVMYLPGGMMLLLVAMNLHLRLQIRQHLRHRKL
jgi:hypothetical protein